MGVFVSNSAGMISVLWGITFFFVLTLGGVEIEMLVWWSLGLSLLVFA